MSRLFPQSLPAWILLIVVAGLLVGQTATLVIAEHGIADTSRSFELFRLGERTIALSKLIYAAPADTRKSLLPQLANSSLSLSISDGPSVDTAIASDDELAELEDIIVAKLTRDGVSDVRIKEEPSSGSSQVKTHSPREDQGAVEQALSEAASDLASSGRFVVSVQFNDGQWLNLAVAVTPEPSILTMENLLFYVGVAFAIILLSLWAIRQLTGPYATLERAVKAIGEDLNRAPLAEAGSREARAAAGAINWMQSRLQDYVREREHLAAALAHDLRTPITRIRLRLELLKDAKLKRSLNGDLTEIEAITQSVVEFASNGFDGDEHERIDLVSLVEAVCDGFPQAKIDSETAATRVVCSGRPIALKRCLANVIDNAIKYGGRATVSMMVNPRSVDVIVDDEGPGIPETSVEDVFKPFLRLEKSRNRQTGGMGLGLTIARGIARAHGGDIRMLRRPQGGMRVMLSLSRCADNEARSAA
jgi:signal transduction histidine kinase